MKITPKLGFMTTQGPIFICQGDDGNFYPVWKDEVLDGPCRTLAAALDNVAGGHCPSPSDGTSLDALHISRDIGFWVDASTLM